MQCLTGGEWAAVVLEMTAILRGRASIGSMITYSELAREMRSVQREAMTKLWITCSLRYPGTKRKAGRGLLSVIVVHEVGDMGSNERN